MDVGGRGGVIIAWVSDHVDTRSISARALLSARLFKAPTSYRDNSDKKTIGYTKHSIQNMWRREVGRVLRKINKRPDDAWNYNIIQYISTVQCITYLST